MKGLPPHVAKSALVFGSIEAALLASSRLQNQVVALEDAPDEPVTGPLMVISPSSEQVIAADPLFLLSHCAPAVQRPCIDKVICRNAGRNTHSDT